MRGAGSSSEGPARGGEKRRGRTGGQAGAVRAAQGAGPQVRSAGHSASVVRSPSRTFARRTRRTRAPRRRSGSATVRPMAEGTRRNGRPAVSGRGRNAGSPGLLALGYADFRCDPGQGDETVGCENVGPGVPSLSASALVPYRQFTSLHALVKSATGPHVLKKSLCI